MGTLFSIISELVYSDSCGYCENQIESDFSDEVENDENVKARNLFEMVQILENWDLEQKNRHDFFDKDYKKNMRFPLKRPLSIDILDTLSPCGLYEKAVTCFIRKDFSKSFKYLSMILSDMNPSNEKALYLRGRILLNQGKYFDAEKDFDRLANELGSPFFGLYGKAVLFLAHDNYLSALDLFGKIISLESKNYEDDEIVALSHLHMAVITQIMTGRFRNSEERTKQHILMIEKLCPRYYEYVEDIVKHF